jgi:hypothetical protein
MDSQNTSNSASFGLLGLVTAFLIGSDWRPIDAIIARLHPDQPNSWGKLHVPSNYDGPFRLDSQNTSNSASFGILGQVTAFLIGSDWRPIDAIIARLQRDQPNSWGKLHVPCNYDGPFRLDSQNTSISASFGLLEVVATFLIGSNWRPIDAIIARLQRDQPN